jgi:hypothetical protein
VSYLRYYPSICLEGLRKTMEKCSGDSLTPGRGLNPRAPEYETEELRIDQDTGFKCMTVMIHGSENTQHQGNNYHYHLLVFILLFFSVVMSPSYRTSAVEMFKTKAKRTHRAARQLLRLESMTCNIYRVLQE